MSTSFVSGLLERPKTSGFIFLITGLKENKMKQKQNQFIFQTNANSLVVSYPGNIPMMHSFRVAIKGYSPELFATESNPHTATK